MAESESTNPLKSFWRWLLRKPAGDKQSSHETAKSSSPRDFLTDDKSAEFREFIISYFPENWAEAKEGHADRQLASLQGAERELAERILLAELDGHRNQESAIRGLGLLSSHAAIGLLHQKLKNSPSFDVALALWRLESDPQMLRVMAEQARLLTVYQKKSAIVQLRDISHQAIVIMLSEFLRDPDKSVRYNAAQSLLYMHGLPNAQDRMEESMRQSEQTGAPCRIDLAAERCLPEVRIMSETPAERNAAIEELIAAIANRPLHGRSGIA